MSESIDQEKVSSNKCVVKTTMKETAKKPGLYRLKILMSLESTYSDCM